jgi:hypothetical protein
MEETLIFEKEAAKPLSDKNEQNHHVRHMAVLNFPFG